MGHQRRVLHALSLIHILRNVRRDGMDYVKKLKKNSEITEDDQKKAEKDLQDLLDKSIKRVDAALAAKEKELMSI